MNLNPKNWFWTQRLMILVFIVIYVTISLTPWYYNIGLRETEGQGLKAIILSNLNDSESDEYSSEFERKYVNNGRMSSMDLLIVAGYLFSLSYVFGLFLSKMKTAIIVNMPVLVFMIMKTIGIRNLSDVYKFSLKHTIIWWSCLIIYYVVFLLHDRTIMTDIKITEKVS